MEAPKLVHVATSAQFWPFLAGQVSYTKAHGFEVHAVSSPGATLGQFAARENVPAWVIPMTRGITPLRDIVALCRLWMLFRRLRPQIVHAHTLKAGLLAMLAACLTRVPIRIYTLHGLVWQTRDGWRRTLLIGLERLTCRLASRVLAVSPSVRRAAVDAGLADPGQIIVPGAGSANGLDFDRFDPARVNRSHGTCPVIGFAGRLVPDKGIAELEAAWERLRADFPALHLLLVGDTERHDPLPAPVLSRLRADPRVHITGWVDEMPAQYALMDVCVLPSRREGLPYAALEAAAMEIPVVGFAVDGMVDAVEDGSTGLLVPPGDAAALAEAIAGLLRCPGVRARMGREARRRCQALYRSEPLWACIHNLYVTTPPTGLPLWWKRPLDVAAALLALVLLAPCMTMVALAVWAALGRPILYRQRRPGFRECSFEMLKFRTMCDVPPRLTRLGRFLRRTSLDELPQLINILRGEMSFIGPRPLLERYLGSYTERERRRHWVRPGLTGWAQVHGRNDLPWNQRLEMDVWYVEHASFRLDASILLRSVWKILTGAGVRDDPSASMLDLDQERQPA